MRRKRAGPGTLSAKMAAKKTALHCKYAERWFGLLRSLPPSGQYLLSGNTPRATAQHKGGRA